jgi:hypothetical protein
LWDNILGAKWDLIHREGAHDCVIKQMTFTKSCDYFVKTLKVHFTTNRCEFDAADYRDVIFKNSSASKAAYVA